MKQIALKEGVSWHIVEFWQIKNILEKMTAAVSLTHVRVMVDHKQPTQLQRSPQLKTSH